jgi:hypothetical protein
MTYKRYALFCFLLFTNACDNLPTVNERGFSFIPSVMAQCVDERKAEVDRLNGQSIQKVQDSEALNLVKQGEEEFQQGQSQKAFETFKEALKLAR